MTVQLAGSGELQEGSLTIAPRKAVAVDISSTDFDITQTLPFASQLYIGVSGDVVAKLIGDSAAVTYKNVPVGVLVGMFVTVVKVGTTATNMVARK